MDVLVRMAMSVMIVVMIVIVPAASIVVMMIVVVAVGMTVPHQTLKPQRASSRSGGQGGGHRKCLFDPAETVAHGVNLQKFMLPPF